VKSIQPDDHFRQEIRIGRHYQEVVCAWIRKLGIHVKHDRLEIRPNGEPVSKYRDNGDLVCISASGRPRNVEVKSKRGPRFNGPEDFPFNTALVMTAEWHRKLARSGKYPHATIIVHQETYGIVVVPRSSERNWSLVDQWTSSERNWSLVDQWTTGGQRSCYHCPKTDLKPWDDFLDWLEWS